MSLDTFRDHLVQVILLDGRVIVGKLRGNDQYHNLILSDCVEREYSSDQGVEMIPLGLYMIKGDNMFRLPGASVYRVDLSATVSELDEDKDSTIDYTEIKAEPLREIRV